MTYSVYVDNQLLFSTNDLNSTPYVVDAKLSMEDNSAGSLELVLLSNCPIPIQRMKSHAMVYRDGNAIWEGRALSEEIDFYNRSTYYFEGALSYLIDSIQPKRTFSGTVRALLEELIKVHNSRVDSDKRFVVGAVTAHGDEEVLTVEMNYETTLDVISSVLVDSEVVSRQGHLRIRMIDGERHLDYLGDYPTTSTQTIKFAENMLDFTQNFELSELATVIIPVGTLKKQDEDDSIDTDEDLPDDSESIEDDSQITIADVNNGSIYLENSDLIDIYGRVEKVVDFGEVEDARDLLSKGKDWFADQQFDDVTIEVSVLDLHYSDSNIEAFNLLDRVHCVSVPHGMDRFFPITKIETNLLQASDTVVTLNHTQEAKEISSVNARTNEIIDAKLKALPSETRILEMAQRNATEIMNTLTNGYVTIVADEKDGHAAEIIISETKDWHESERLWKWNMNGFAYSKDGGKTWGLAITMDGAIVANYITSGVMSADRIQGGTLRLGGIGNYNGKIEVYNSDNVLVGSWDVNGMYMLSGSKLNVAIEIDNGRFRAYRDGQETGYINGNQHIIHDDYNIDGYGMRVAGRNGIILRGPIIGVSKDFLLDDEGGYYDTGGNGILKVVSDVWLDGGSIRYSYNNVRFTNGLMTTDVGSSSGGGGGNTGGGSSDENQTEIENEFESYFLDLKDPSNYLSDWRGIETFNTMIVNCNDVRQTATGNDGLVTGTIQYDMDTAQYKNGNAILSDYPMIFGFGPITASITNDSYDNDGPNVYLVYVGHYYNSWYISAPIRKRGRYQSYTQQTPQLWAAKYNSLFGSFSSTEVSGSTDAWSWRGLIRNYAESVSIPNYRNVLMSMQKDLGTEYTYGSDGQFGEGCPAVQFYWEDGKFYIQPGVAWNTNYIDMPGYNNVYGTSYFSKRSSVIDVPAVDITDSLIRLDYSCGRNKIYAFASDNAALEFVRSFIDKN